MGRKRKKYRIQKTKKQLASFRKKCVGALVKSEKAMRRAPQLVNAWKKKKRRKK
jgi:hypothetical protein